jgi:hypothetical protein
MFLPRRHPWHICILTAAKTRYTGAFEIHQHSSVKLRKKKAQDARLVSRSVCPAQC